MCVQQRWARIYHRATARLTCYFMIRAGCHDVKHLKLLPKNFGRTLMTVSALERMTSVYSIQAKACRTLFQVMLLS